MTKEDTNAVIERVALALAEAHDSIQNPRKNYAAISYRAGASVDYWEAQARAALKAIGGGSGYDEAKRG